MKVKSLADVKNLKDLFSDIPRIQKDGWSGELIKRGKICPRCKGHRRFLSCGGCVKCCEAIQRRMEKHKGCIEAFVAELFREGFTFTEIEKSTELGKRRLCKIKREKVD